MVYTVHGILQARILKWVAFLFYRDLANPGIELSTPNIVTINYRSLINLGQIN